MTRFFVTGTDTAVGKTWVTCALLAALNQQGLRTLGLKPIASGCTETPQGWQNEDALQLQAAASVHLPYAQINPFAFKAAIAPHIAAEQENRPLSAANIAQTVEQTLDTQAHDVALIEGAGGWRVPFNAHENQGDYVRQLTRSVILVVGVRLGCLNHALLTWDTLQHEGVHVAGWVANLIDPQMEALEENVSTLRVRITTPCLGVMPFMPTSSPEELARYLDIMALLNTSQAPSSLAREGQGAGIKKTLSRS